MIDEIAFQTNLLALNTAVEAGDESGKVLGEIVTRVKKVTDVMAEIADSSREQASGIEQVNRTVTSMDAMTQQNAALVEEAAAPAQSLEPDAAGQCCSSPVSRSSCAR